MAGSSQPNLLPFTATYCRPNPLLFAQSEQAEYEESISQICWQGKWLQSVLLIDLDLASRCKFHSAEASIHHTHQFWGFNNMFVLCNILFIMPLSHSDWIWKVCGFVFRIKIRSLEMGQIYWEEICVDDSRLHSWGCMKDKQKLRMPLLSNSPPLTSKCLILINLLQFWYKASYPPFSLLNFRKGFTCKFHKLCIATQSLCL